MPRQTPLLQGTLDLLILRALSLGDMHGLGVSRRINELTQGTYAVLPGSLFPALHRLEERGWISPWWGESESNRRAKFYKLTASGRKQLAAETDDWNRVAAAMRAALEGT